MGLLYEIALEIAMCIPWFKWCKGIFSIFSAAWLCCAPGAPELSLMRSWIKNKKCLDHSMHTGTANRLVQVLLTPSWWPRHNTTVRGEEGLESEWSEQAGIWEGYEHMGVEGRWRHQATGQETFILSLFSHTYTQFTQTLSRVFACTYSFKCT